MKKGTRKLISRFFTVTTVAQIAFYSYVYLKKARKASKNASEIAEGEVSELENLV